MIMCFFFRSFEGGGVLERTMDLLFDFWVGAKQQKLGMAFNVI